MQANGQTTKYKKMQMPNARMAAQQGLLRQ